MWSDFDEFEFTEERKREIDRKNAWHQFKEVENGRDDTET